MDNEASPFPAKTNRIPLNEPHIYERMDAPMSIWTRRERDADGKRSVNPWVQNEKSSPECRDRSRIPARVRHLFPAHSALLLRFPGLTFVWSLRARGTDVKGTRIPMICSHYWGGIVCVPTPA